MQEYTSEEYVTRALTEQLEKRLQLECNNGKDVLLCAQLQSQMARGVLQRMLSQETVNNAMSVHVHERVQW